VTERREYLKKATSTVVAVRLDLETDGFTYEKWGVYTVDAAVFARTYRPVSPGLWRKVTPVWAEKAEHDGYVETLEGVTHYEAGDYIVYNDPGGTDAYAMRADSFEAMYEPVR
jgi:hypothetical protein